MSITQEDVDAKEASAVAAEALVPTDTAAANYTSLNNAAINARAEANSLKSQFDIQTHTLASNNFDFVGDEAFYISDDYGRLRGSTGADPLVQVDLSNLAGASLSESFFKTHEGTQYIWTDGNTYTFGGSRDYSYGNGYEVGIAEFEDAEMKTWDGLFPYDIAIPNAAGDCDFNTDSLNESFDNLPPNYKVVVPIANFFIRKPDFDPNNNAVSKNVGHGYDYQLGDQYSIQLSQNSHEVTAIDLNHSFETVGIKEEHSHVGISAEFNAHGLDSEMSITAVDFSLGVTGLKLGIDATIADISVEVTGYKRGFEVVKRRVTTEKIGTDYNYAYIDTQHSVEHIKNKIESFEGVSTEIRNDDKIISNNKRNLSHADEGISFNTEEVDFPSSFPAPLTQAGYAALEANLTAASAVTPPTPATAAAVTAAQTALDTATASINNHRATSALQLFTDREFNNDRADKLPIAGTVPDSNGHIDIKPKHVGLSSFTKAKSFSEIVLNGDKKIVELNLRDHDQKLKAKINNISQKLDLTKSAYFVTNYTEAAKYSQLWLTNAAGTGDMKANSAGMLVQTKAAQIGKLLLDSGANKAEFSIAKDASNKIEQKLEAATGKYSLDINAGKGKFEILNEKATLSVKQAATSIILNQDDIALKSKTLKVEPATSATLKSNKVTIDSNDITIGKATFKPTDVKVPVANITLGQGASLMKVSPAGVDIKGTKISIAGTGIAEVKGAMIKIG